MAGRPLACVCSLTCPSGTSHVPCQWCCSPAALEVPGRQLPVADDLAVERHEPQNRVQFGQVDHDVPIVQGKALIALSSDGHCEASSAASRLPKAEELSAHLLPFFASGHLAHPTERLSIQVTLKSPGLRTTQSYCTRRSDSFNSRQRLPDGVRTQVDCPLPCFDRTLA